MKPKETIRNGAIDFSIYSEQDKLEALEYIFKDTKYKNTQSKDLLFYEDHKINIDLWPSSKWEKEDLKSFQNVLREF